jgi:hypothetical protein
VFDAAAQAGIFVVLRPGPYINAETTAGGLALWATSLVQNQLRTNESGVMDSWDQYIGGIINQVSTLCCVSSKVSCELMGGL